MAWWVWLLIGWTGHALVLAPLLGLALREAERRERIDLGLAPETTAGPARPAARRRIPVPPMASVLLLTGVSLEAVGLVIRASGNEHGAARLQTMDLPLAVP